MDHRPSMIYRVAVLVHRLLRAMCWSTDFCVG